MWWGLGSKLPFSVDALPKQLPLPSPNSCRVKGTKRNQNVKLGHVSSNLEWTWHVVLLPLHSQTLTECFKMAACPTHNVYHQIANQLKQANSKTWIWFLQVSLKQIAAFCRQVWNPDSQGFYPPTWWYALTWRAGASPRRQPQTCGLWCGYWIGYLVINSGGFEGSSYCICRIRSASSRWLRHVMRTPTTPKAPLERVRG